MQPQTKMPLLTRVPVHFGCFVRTRQERSRARAVGQATYSPMDELQRMPAVCTGALTSAEDSDGQLPFSEGPGSSWLGGGFEIEQA